MSGDDKEIYLQPIDDGLPMRMGESYAVPKLKVVELYLQMAMNAVKDNPWRATYYIDLQAGPGKNNLGGTVALGSPLIALSCPVPFQYYRFNEADSDLVKALKKRVSASPLRKHTRILQMDVNLAVEDFCDEIKRRDELFMRGKWSSFNIAFLDPEGLELHWSTVEKLGNMKRMDLIINFSTGGLNRTRLTSPDVGNRFFGTDEWQKLVPGHADAATKRRAWIDFYLKRLTDLGYKYQTDDQESAEIIAKNSKNVQVYSIIFASKHDLGFQLWKEAIRLAQQPRLF